MKLREQNDASTSALRAYAQHERPFSARPERSAAKSKDERATTSCHCHKGRGNLDS